MYLTALVLQPRTRMGQRLLADVQLMHRAVMSGFGPQVGNTAGPGRVLWRVDFDEPGQPLLYVQSAGQPDLPALASAVGAADAGRSRSLDPLWDRLVEGTTLSFRLTANPSRTLTGAGQRDPERWRGKRVPHLTPAGQVEWLLRKGASSGFTVPTNRLGAPEAAVIGRRVAHARRGPADVSVYQVTYAGRLRIDDPTRFRQAVTAGIGPAKGYGCGLISLARSARS